jgi:hypothetical protein
MEAIVLTMPPGDPLVQFLFFIPTTLGCAALQVPEEGIFPPGTQQ